MDKIGCFAFFLLYKLEAYGVGGVVGRFRQDGVPGVEEFIASSPFLTFWIL